VLISAWTSEREKTENTLNMKIMKVAVVFAVLAVMMSVLFVENARAAGNRFFARGVVMLNAKADFSGPASSAMSYDRPPLNKDPIYDDGYVGDSRQAGAPNPWVTRDWGYDHPSQIDGRYVWMHTATEVPAMSAFSGSDDDMGFGAEVGFQHTFGEIGPFFWGAEANVGYVNLNFSQSGSSSGTGEVVSDKFDPYTVNLPGSWPPPAPFRGSFASGAGPWLYAASEQRVVSATPFMFERYQELDTDLFFLKVGPFLRLPVLKGVNIDGGIGFAAGYAKSDYRWNDRVTTPVGSINKSDSGSVSESDFPLGWYASAGVSVGLGKKWDLNGGLQFMSLQDVSFESSGRRADLRLGETLVVGIGLGKSF